jgi:hypothetical protein
MGIRLSSGRSDQAAGRRNSQFLACVGRFGKGECKRSTIWLKKAGLVYDLLEKI